jgi:hypothetical protein
LTFRRWSIPKEGCYAVRNVIIIIIGVCFLLSLETINTRQKERKMWREEKIQSDRVEAIMLEAG